MGIVIAFQNYNLFKGIAGSQSVGMANFEFVFKMRDFSIAAAKHAAAELPGS